MYLSVVYLKIQGSPDSRKCFFRDYSNSLKHILMLTFFCLCVCFKYLAPTPKDKGMFLSRLISKQ